MAVDTLAIGTSTIRVDHGSGGVAKVNTFGLVPLHLSFELSPFIFFQYFVPIPVQFVELPVDDGFFGVGDPPLSL